MTVHQSDDLAGAIAEVLRFILEKENLNTLMTWRTCLWSPAAANSREIFNLRYFRMKRHNARRFLPIMLGTTHDDAIPRFIGASANYPKPELLHPTISDNEEPH